MKNIAALSLLFLFLFLFCIMSASAQPQDYPTKAGEKLATGVANAVTGVVEIPKTMAVTGHEKGATYGLTTGFFTGIVHAIGRSLSGALDIATFMVPTTPVTQPQFIWDDFDKETTYQEPRMR